VDRGWGGQRREDEKGWVEFQSFRTKIESIADSNIRDNYLESDLAYKSGNATENIDYFQDLIFTVTSLFPRV
jgi:hypothetical protein